jgi:hypothetical protein
VQLCFAFEEGAGFTALFAQDFADDGGEGFARAAHEEFGGAFAGGFSRGQNVRVQVRGHAHGGGPRFQFVSHPKNGAGHAVGSESA